MMTPLKSPIKLSTEAQLVFNPRPNIRRMVRAAQYDNNMERISTKLEEILSELQMYTEEIELRHRQGSDNEFSRKGLGLRKRKIVTEENQYCSHSIHDSEALLSLLGLYTEADGFIHRDHDLESNVTPTTDIILDLICDSPISDVDLNAPEILSKLACDQKKIVPIQDEDIISGQSGKQYRISGPLFLQPEEQLPTSPSLQPFSQPFRKVISTVEDTLEKSVAKESPTLESPRAGKLKMGFIKASKLIFKTKWLSRRHNKQSPPSLESKYPSFEEETSVVEKKTTEEKDDSNTDLVDISTMEEFYTRESLVIRLESFLSIELPRLKVDRWVQTEPIVAEEVANMTYEAFKTKAYRLRKSIRTSLISFKLPKRRWSTYSEEVNDAAETRGSSLQSFTAYVSRHLI